MAGRPESRAEAIDDALRNAVEQAMGTFVTVDLVVENREIVDEKILSQTRGYIQNYDVTSEEEKGGLYRVRVQAQVKIGKVHDDLVAAGLLMQRKQMPRLMVVMDDRSHLSETLLQRKQYVDSIRNIVESEFLQRKFPLVDHAQHVGQQQMAAATGDVETVVALAKDSGAEVVILTEANRYFVRSARVYGSTYEMYRSDVRIRAIETGTGKVIFSESRQDQESANLDPVYASAKELSVAAIEAILQKWSLDVSNATAYKIKVRDAEFAQLIQLEERLRSIRGVDALHRRSFAAKQANYDIQYRGNIDALVRNLHEVASPALAVTGVTQQSVEIELK